MREESQISGLIASVYDAALEPSLWSDLVADINQFVGGRACGLFSKDPISKSGKTHYYCGADPHYIQTYAETYAKFDPLATLPGLGQVVSIPDLVAFDEYKRGPFYQEWLRPQGCIDAANVVLENSIENCPILMTVLLSRRMADNDIRRRMAMIVPHAQRALTINKAIELKHSEATTFASALDGISAGVFFLGPNCRIAHANSAAQSMLSGCDFLRSVEGQLVACNLHTNRVLHAIFAPDGDIAAAQGMALTFTAQDGGCYVGHILPLTAAMRRGTSKGIKASAVLFVRKRELNYRSASESIARAYGLTSAELRVLLSIVEVGGVPEVAAALGIAETTVKTHLHRVFSKTGTRRQADLAKLAAEFSSPLAH
ncbi:MAG: LuxR family transcriptional regulator [Bradyrhizobiaceae bacterium]|nr:MAG: LuxR family transcriptional regulator [Bradyrhizobiaceae bacterium]